MPWRLPSGSEPITGVCCAAPRARKPFRGAASGRLLLRLGVVVLPVLAACSYLKSDEQPLRDEFRIPRTVVLDSMSVYPKEAGWFGREGLTIDAVFRFSHSQFETYRRRAEQGKRWKPLPPSREFLTKMLVFCPRNRLTHRGGPGAHPARREEGAYPLADIQPTSNAAGWDASVPGCRRISGTGHLGIRSHIEAVERSYAMQGRPAPPRGSVYNRTEDQLYDELTRRLPLDLRHGLYQYRTAGNDIMHSRKIPCSVVKGDLNDYMLAVLDFDEMVLRIRVHASY